MEGLTSACKVWHAYGWISHCLAICLLQHWSHKVTSIAKTINLYIYCTAYPLYIALFAHILFPKFSIFSVTLKKDSAVLLFNTTNN